MHLKRLKISNFRCYRDEICIDFDDITAIVGRNDAGKSTIMDALSIFFGEQALDKDDGCLHGDRKSVSVSCEFGSIPELAVLDEDFQTTFADEYLLNQNGNLEIRKVWNAELATPKLVGTYAYAMHPSTKKFNDLLELKKSELAARAKELGVDISGVNKNANAPVRSAIWKSCPDLILRESLISLDKEDAKQIWARISIYLPAFALFKSDRASTDQDPEAQDPLKAAIKDALKHRAAELDAIKDFVEVEVRKIAEDTLKKLREMDASLANTLSPIVSTKSWSSLFQTSITGDLGIPLNKRGSGVKRLVLLNFFRAKAERMALDKNAGSIIYAVEEPETSQHPRNQRMLMSALTALSASPNCQVIVTTHTPMLARAIDDRSIRFVQTVEDGSREVLSGGKETNKLISKTLGVLPDNSVKLFLGVEGKHDIAFLKGMARLLIEDGLSVPNLEQLEVDGELIFFPFGGENLALWTSRLEHLNRPELHIYDRDHEPPANPKYHKYIVDVNARDGCKGLVTEKREMENYVHSAAIIEAYGANGNSITLVERFLSFDDVPKLVAQSVHIASNTGELWDTLKEEKQKKKVSSAKSILNNGAIAKMTRKRLEETDPANEVIGWFNEIRSMMKN